MSKAKGQRLKAEVEWGGMYVLEGKRAVRVSDVVQWGKWFEKADRRVKETKIGKVRISTVFLGMNHEYRHGRRPLLFETMVFGGLLDQEQRRWSTWAEAEAGHDAVVAGVLNARGPRIKRRKHAS